MVLHPTMIPKGCLQLQITWWCLSLALIHLIDAETIVQGNVSGQGEQFCNETEVFINVTGKCLPKVFFNEPCKFSQQCGSAAFCGFENLRNDSKVCRCNDGYHVKGKSNCVAIRPCMDAGFNSAQLQGDCGERQFCRHNVCLCAPDFVFDENGECTSKIEYDPTTFIRYAKQFKPSSLDAKNTQMDAEIVNARLEEQARTLTLALIVIFIILGLIIFIMTTMIYYGLPKRDFTRNGEKAFKQRSPLRESKAKKPEYHLVTETENDFIVKNEPR